MNKVRIKAIRQTVYPDLMAKYENPIEHTCDIKEGQQNALKGCALLLGTPCVSLWSRWPEAKETSTMAG